MSESQMPDGGTSFQVGRVVDATHAVPFLAGGDGSGTHHLRLGK